MKNIEKQKLHQGMFHPMFLPGEFYSDVQGRVGPTKSPKAALRVRDLSRTFRHVCTGTIDGVEHISWGSWDYGLWMTMAFFLIGYLHYDKKPMTIIICSSSVFKWVDIYARSSSSMTYAPHVNDDFVPRCQGFSGRFSAVIDMIAICSMLEDLPTFELSHDGSVC